MRAENIRRVAIIGAGLMGSGIALEYAGAGLLVSLVDANPEMPERALRTIKSNLSFLVEEGIIEDRQAQEASKNMVVAQSLEEATREAELVVECVPEDLTLKRELFRKLENICMQDAILATNTSSISITKIGSSLATAHRVVGTHYWNPPYLMPLVEVTAGAKTSSETLSTIGELLRRIGKVPIVVKKDIPGFIWNRLQFALLRECLNLVEQGVASVEDIDQVVRKGLGRRLALVGPFETADLGGLDVFHSICLHLFPELSNSVAPPRFFTDKVGRGELGVKTGKGFYDWGEKSAQDKINYRNSNLSRLLLEDRRNEDYSR